MQSTVDSFHRALKAIYPHMATIIEQNAREFGIAWEEEFGSFLEGLKGDISNLEQLARSYAHFSLGIMLSQKRYEQTGAYEYSNFEAVKANVYDNETFINEAYMPGLLLSHFLWPHHYRLLRFFEQDVLDELRMQHPTTFCEVGIGTGLYSLKTLQRLSGVTGIGYDISRPALAFGQGIIQSFGQLERLAFELRDITRETIQQVDFLICQEVLEHLEDPTGFLRFLAAAVKPGGRAYITAAMTAGQIDHIYLFETLQEIYNMLEQVSLTPLMVRMEGARVYSDIRLRPRVAAFYCLHS